MWCFPGGGYELEETYEQTLEREVFEEYELRVQGSNCSFLMSRNWGNNNYVYVCPVGGDQEPVLHEGADMKWMDIEEIKKIDIGFEQGDVVGRWERWLLESEVKI